VKPLSVIEKRMLVLTLLLLALLLVKSLWMDEYTPKDASELAVMNHCEAREVLSRNPLTYQRIVDLIPLEEEDIAAYEGDLKFDYRIKVRWYLLGVLPYHEKSQYIEE